jgi:hypothetical protein
VSKCLLNELRDRINRSSYRKIDDSIGVTASKIPIGGKPIPGKVREALSQKGHVRLTFDSHH